MRLADDGCPNCPEHYGSPVFVFRDCYNLTISRADWERLARGELKTSVES